MSLKEQTYPSKLVEIIVADGQSTDNTRALVEHFIQQNPETTVQLIDNPGRTYSAGFNAALRQARGDVVVFAGGHTVLSPDYIHVCAHFLQTSGTECVGGESRTEGTTPKAKAIAYAMASPFALGGVSFRGKNGTEVREVDTVAYGAYRRRVFDDIGSLDEELVRNQDDEFNYRLRKVGGKILLVPGIYAQYSSPRASASALWRQYYSFGYWKVRVMQKHPYQMQPRQFVPFVFVSTLFILPIIAIRSRLARRILMAEVVAYAIANILASVQIATEQGWRYMAFVPRVFATIHISYGLGFLAGLAHFRERWRR